MIFHIFFFSGDKHYLVSSQNSFKDTKIKEDLHSIVENVAFRTSVPDPFITITDPPPRHKVSVIS